MFLLGRLNMGARKSGPGWRKSFGRLGARIALGFLSCACAAAEVTDPAQMLERMRANFILESGASTGNRIEAEVTWRMKEDGPALRSGNVVDQWLVLSDGLRFGTERYRQSPDGNQKTRTVYQGDERRVFEFDLNAAGAEAVAGKLGIRHQFNRGPNRRLPLQDYLDRVLGPPNRWGFMYDSLVIAPEMVLINGHRCHEIRGAWNGRNFTFWLDPNFGYLPRQYTMQLMHANASSGRRLGWRNPADLRMLAPPPELSQSVIPIRSEERLSAVELMQGPGQCYLASGVLDRTQYFEGGAIYSEHAVIRTGDFDSGERRDVNAFLEFDGLLRNGTPVEEIRQGDRHSPDTVERYILSEGRKLHAHGSFSDYLIDLRQDLLRLGRDFSLQNLQRLDSKFLIAVCAVAALLINGGIAYASYRKKKAKPS